MYRLKFFFSLLMLICSCSGKNEQSRVQLRNIPYDGIWAEHEDANALFVIKGDTIENFEHGDRMHYKIAGDTFIIDYVDFIGKHVILKHTEDSLVLKNEDGSITKLYRR